MREHTLYLANRPTGTVTSLNDGALASAPGVEAETSFAYPDPQWAIGPVALSPTGPDPVRRVSTFTSEALAEDVLVAGAPVLTLHLSTTRDDANVIVKLAVQQPQSAEDRAQGRQPAAQTVSKGWLRASHRALDPAGSIGGLPYHPHRVREPLAPGEVYELQIELTPLAHRFPAGARIRLELTCADSTVTDLQCTHAFTPEMAGTDSYHHGGAHPSRLALPVLEGTL